MTWRAVAVACAIGARLRAPSLIILILLILSFPLSVFPSCLPCPRSLLPSDPQPTDADRAADTAVAATGTVHAQAHTDADTTPGGSAQVGTIRA